MVRSSLHYFAIALGGVAVCALTALAVAAPPLSRPLRIPERSPLDAATEASTNVRDAGCGRDGGVDCPLQGWMKVNAGPPSKTGDIDLLAAAFDGIASFAPHASAYPNWTSIAKDGAAVARRGRVDAARVACVSCHDQYRTRFIRELREVPLSELPDAGEIDAGAKP